ncbi:lysophospholipid acyltransferase family protein [Vibrio harveyi]|uniref:lysophospholipid acyltransferase family protein n=1 Tax=Vibrio harveyi TaxID=669 RepID=UPI003CED4079
MNKTLKVAFFLIVVKPIVLVALGLNIVNREKLPISGNCIVAANHNSHLDTMILMSLFPLSMLHKVRPVAAADYFLRNRFLTWFFLNVVGIIPIDRKVTRKSRESVLDDCKVALENGEVLIIFPEGSRGEPEVMGTIKKGIYHLVKEDPQRFVLPVMMRGLGMALPKGTALFVPFNCDVIVGEPVRDFSSSDDYVSEMKRQYRELGERCIVQPVSK